MRNIVIIGCLFILCLVSCEKEYDSNNIFSKHKKIIEDYPFILPVNFGEYNKAKITKSTNGTGYHFNFCREMLDTSQIYQEEVKPGVIYTEIPIKGRLFCRTTSECINGSSNNDDFVRAKMFYVKKEFCVEDSLSERIITMIPTIGYTANYESFSYLNMPNFTGTIITSSLNGDPIDVWGIKKGYIVFGEFDKENKDSVFASLEFSDYPYEGVSNGVNTKSHNMDDTLDACYVVVKYTIKYGSIPESYTTTIIDPSENNNRDLFIPLVGGGVLADEEENTRYYTAIIHNNFCNSESVNNVFYCVKNTDLELKAKSAQNDSCIFFCWKQHNKVLSHRPEITIKMDDNYDITAKYQPIINKSCYELAKLATDTLLDYKIDSLRMFSRSTKYEGGVARREDGSFYNLTGGTESSISITLEPGVKYSSIFHTHPQNSCIPSAADICALYINLSRYSEQELFRFGIITENVVLYLNLVDKDKVTMVDFFTNLAKIKGHDKVQDKLYKSYIRRAIKKMGRVDEASRYMVCLEELSPFFSDIGLSVSCSVKDNNGTIPYWYNVSNDSEGEILLNECF